jgi:MYXO-CTERM domain-containing protein
VSSSTVSYVVWGLLAAAALGLYGVSRRRSDAVARPARVVERLATGPLLRVALVLGLMWVGWHLFAR